MSYFKFIYKKMILHFIHRNKQNAMKVQIAYLMKNHRGPNILNYLITKKSGQE